MNAIVLANTMPGHLADPGRLSEIQELISVATMVMILIWMISVTGKEEVWKRDARENITYAEWNNVDVCY